MSHSSSNNIAQELGLSPRELSPELQNLFALIETLPVELRPSFNEAAQKVVEGIESRRDILNFVQETLSQLRLDMKYMIFDLEATKKERDLFQSQLDNHQPE